MVKRVFLIVLDGLGIGELKDAEKFNDEGAFTLKSLYETKKLNIPNLIGMGLYNIKGLEFFGKTPKSFAAYGKFSEKSMGKDSTIGHWEIAGIESKKPLPTYENGFPCEIINEFEKRTGKKVICNKPYSGTEVIKAYGDYHLKTGDLIVYTSADSVFQIAAHEEKVPLSKLYEYCKIAREILTGENGVGRVIARPFLGESGNYFRTENRKDFSIEPPSKTMLDILKENNLDVISVGKIYDLFAGKGITKKITTHSNVDVAKTILKCINQDFNGLLFSNFVDFDMIYGHRNDAVGYANALNEFDLYLGEILKFLKDEDVLIITADHGCDPGDISTDHTREYIPLLMAGKTINPVDLGEKDGFYHIGATILDMFGLNGNIKGTSFLQEVTNN